MKRRPCPFPLLLGCLLVAGCATVPVRTSRPTPPAPPRPTDPITPEVRVAFAAARRAWSRAERTGWSGDACATVAEAFVRTGRLAEDAHQPLAAAWYDAALARRRCGGNDAAEALLRRALQADARHGPARVQLGLLELRRGRTDAAWRAFEEASQAAPQTAEAWIDLAILQRRRGRPDDLVQAEQNLRRALAVDASSLPAFHELAMLYLAQAGERPELLRLADVVCRQAAKLDPHYAPLYNAWGLVAVRQGDPIAALGRFERALTLDASSFEANMNFGSVAIAYRGYDDAQRAFTRARGLRPRSYEARLALGAALRGLGHTRAAEAEYRAAIELDATRPEAYFNLGLLHQDYLEGGVADLQRARACYQAFQDRVGRRADLAARSAEAADRARNAEQAVAALASVRPGAQSPVPSSCTN